MSSRACAIRGHIARARWDERPHLLQRRDRRVALQEMKLCSMRSREETQEAMFLMYVSGRDASVRSRGLQLLASASKRNRSSSPEARTLHPIRPRPPARRRVSELRFQSPRRCLANKKTPRSGGAITKSPSHRPSSHTRRGTSHTHTHTNAHTHKQTHRSHSLPRHRNPPRPFRFGSALRLRLGHRHRQHPSFHVRVHTRRVRVVR